ncbi:MAG: hypothetical protein AB1938_06350 [Myxococcota bacterium]
MKATGAPLTGKVKATSCRSCVPTKRTLSVMKTPKARVRPLRGAMAKPSVVGTAVICCSVVSAVAPDASSSNSVRR